MRASLLKVGLPDTLMTDWPPIAQIYLPTYGDCTVEFMQQVMSGQKLVRDCSSHQGVVLPQP